MRVTGALGWVALAVGAVGMVIAPPWLGRRPRVTATILLVVGLLLVGLSVQVSVS